MNKVYMCIDLKSFYASVECAERNLDPLDTNLVVADKSRTEKTICLAVSPSLKEYGLKGRARLFEVVSAVRKINIERSRMAETCKKASAILVFWNGFCYNKSKYGFLCSESQEEMIWK